MCFYQLKPSEFYILSCEKGRGLRPRLNPIRKLIKHVFICVYFQDDHGSPLACVSEDSGSNTEELAGILSWIVVVQVTGAENREACSLVHPVVYTRISEYTDWIEGITGTLRRI